MAKNFRIFTHRNEGTLHLKLMGDFDGTSACQLLSVLKRNSNSTSKAFIHTSGLRNIYPFGLNVFHNNLNVIKRKLPQFVFTGEKCLPISTGKTYALRP